MNRQCGHGAAAAPSAAAAGRAHGAKIAQGTVRSVAHQPEPGAPVEFSTATVSPFSKSASPVQFRVPFCGGSQVWVVTLPAALLMQEAQSAPAAPVSISW